MTALRDAGTRVSGIVTVFLMLLVAGIPEGIQGNMPGGMIGTITGSTMARADAPAPMITASLSGHSHADSTYLSLTRERMRQQLAARDLEAAARTLQWIRRIDPDDAVASVLATELQLRRGNVAAAAMRLIEVLDGSTATDASRAEAQRILTLLAQEGSGAAVMVTRALPAWLSFNNQNVGGAVQYFWEIGANEAPWRNGSKTLSLQAQSSGMIRPQPR